MFRRLLKTDHRLAAEYLRTSACPKLQIGGGPRTLETWLNTDLNPAPGVMRMDATRRFPFDGETFQYVFSEHMIEHVTYSQGAFMLSEIYRVLRRGGKIRITTPDLSSLASLLLPNPSPVAKEYSDWFYATFIPSDWPRTSSGLMNAFLSFWGHEFVYDESTITEVISAAGFSNICRHRLNLSNDINLMNIENTGRYPDGLLDFESMAFEAIKC